MSGLRGNKGVFRLIYFEWAERGRDRKDTGKEEEEDLEEEVTCTAVQLVNRNSGNGCSATCLRFDARRESPPTEANVELRSYDQRQLRANI